MSGVVGRNLGLHVDIQDHDTWGTEGRENDRRLDNLVMPAVKAVVDSLPAAPDDGDRYLLSAAASSHAGEVAAWNGTLGTWVYYPAKSGWSEWVEATRATMRYQTGAWFNSDLVVNVKAFGAKGDSVTSDTAAVLAALVAAPAGSRLHFPAGTYLLTSWAVQTLAKVLWISGDGVGATILKGVGPSTNAPTNGVDFLSITTAPLRCSDMTFDSWGVVFNFSALSTIVDRVLFENVEIKNFLRGVYGSNAIVITIASVDISTETLTTTVAHGLSVGNQLVFANTGGGLPTGITAGVTYYVLTVPTPTTLTLSATLGGTTLLLSGTNTGTSTAYRAGSGFRNFRVRGCRLDTSFREAVFLNLGIMEQAYIAENVITNVVGKGIDLGGNALALADVRGEYVIENNIIENVSNIDSRTPGTPVAGLVAGIVYYGWRAIVTGNTVKNIYKIDPNASDTDGIYSKCRYGEISKNILVDASQAEAAINIKGGAKNETVVQPYGFAVLCEGNVILDTQVNPTATGGGKRSSGIKIATSEVMVRNNYLEGLTDVGIYTDSDTGSDAPCHNSTVMDNTIKDHRGYIGIGIYGAGNRVRVEHNLIDTILNTFQDAAPPQAFGILIAKKGLANVDVTKDFKTVGLDVIGNRIYNVPDNGGSSAGIMIKPSSPDQVLYAAPPCKQFLLSSLRVMDNHIDTAHFGIQYSYDSSINPAGSAWVKVDDVFQRHNTGRNINGNVTPVLTDLEKFSDTPTNLIYIPYTAAAGVIGLSRTGSTSAPMVELNKDSAVGAAVPQNFRVIGNDDGAGNRSWLALETSATETHIATGHDGTGTARPLFIIIDGTAIWRLLGTDIRPETDAVTDIGTLTKRIHQIFAGSTDASAAKRAGLVLSPGDSTGGYLKIRSSYLWVDATGALRIKGSTPTTDLDGVTVGSQ